jgi:hypothetical protein
LFLIWNCTVWCFTLKIIISKSFVFLNPNCLKINITHPLHSSLVIKIWFLFGFPLKKNMQIVKKQRFFGFSL